MIIESINSLICVSMFHTRNCAYWDKITKILHFYNTGSGSKVIPFFRYSCPFCLKPVTIHVDCLEVGPGAIVLRGG